MAAGGVVLLTVLAVALVPRPAGNETGGSSVTPETGDARGKRKLLPYRRDVAGDRTAATREAEAERKQAGKDPDENYGHAPAVPGDANPQVASVVAAQKSGEHAERLSPFIAPAPFDPEVYKADPRTYLNTIEPGRVFQTAQPGPRVPRLRAQGRTFVRLVQGETADLVVQAAPGAPVTFLSLDLGTFANGLVCTTVQADGQGVATATFKATPGAIANCNVLVGCPLASGQIRFSITIERPEA